MNSPHLVVNELAVSCVFTQIDLFPCLSFGERKNKKTTHSGYMRDLISECLLKLATPDTPWCSIYSFLLQPPCRWPSPVFLPQRASSFLRLQPPPLWGTIPSGDSWGKISSSPFLSSLASPPVPGDAWVGGADGGNWWWVFGDEIKIHSGSPGGGVRTEGYTSAHLDQERAVIDDGGHPCWKRPGKATVSPSPERCLSKETALETYTEN